MKISLHYGLKIENINIQNFLIKKMQPWYSPLKITQLRFFNLILDFINIKIIKKKHTLNKKKLTNLHFSNTIK